MEWNYFWYWLCWVLEKIRGDETYAYVCAYPHCKGNCSGDRCY